MTHPAQSFGFFRALSASFALLAFTGDAAAQWAFQAAPDPFVRGVSVFPNTPTAGTTTLFANTSGAGVFKGVDTGANPTWQQINTGLPNLQVTAFLTTSATTLYAGTDAGVYLSTNQGASWTASNGAGANILGCHLVTALTRLNTVFYAGTRCRSNSGVYRSTDSGANWTRVGFPTIPGDAYIQSIGINSDGTQVRVQTRKDGVFFSADSGLTYVQRNNGLPANPNIFNTQCSAFCTGTQSIILAYVEGAGVFKSVDLGLNWTPSNTGLPAGFNALSGISRDGSTTPPTFYVSTDKQGIFRSTDEGASWTLMGASATSPAVAFPRGVSRDTSAPGKFYVATHEGVAKTTDSGATWVTNNMSNGMVRSVHHDIVNPAAVYLSTATVFKLSNVYTLRNTNVAPSDAGITSSMTGGVVIGDPVSANTLYATTNNKGIFKSTNGAASWTPINAGLPSLVGQGSRPSIDPTNPNIIYLAFTSGAGIYKSIDAGASWSASSTGLVTEYSKYVNRIEVNPSTPATVYAATGDGAYKSINAGASWTKIYEAFDATGVALPVANLRVNPANPAEVYLATAHTNTDGFMLASAGLQKSTNGGSTWTNVLPGRLVENVRVLTNGAIYAGVSAAPGQPAIYRSNNAGATWSSYSAGLKGSDIRTFGTDVGNTRLLSASLEDGFYTLQPGQNDFNADVRPDLIWSNTANGSTYLWNMVGPVFQSDAFIAGIDPAWKVQGVADFNGDGHPDIVWRNTANGNTYVWYMNGATLISDAFLFGLPPEWVIQGVADFNGDGKPDFLMRNTVTGNAFAWFFNDNVAIGDQFLFNIDPQWKVEAVADLNGDSQPDLLFRNQVSGLAFAWNTQFSGGNLSLAASSPPIFGIDPVWEIVQMEDWNQDNQPDLLFRNRNTGVVFVWYMTGTTLQGSDFITQIDPSWEIVPRR